ncbi:RIP metalloprotease RseP [Streptococcus sp. DD10]|uniref:RIP metalloprotease RseP n=1 Tax=Streptococcus sp. DD10 TaxID=1777878 RepID=UPI0012E780A1
MGFLTFLIIFGVIVVVHEFGHFYFAKKSGILVREFAIGMGPKLFSHIGKDGTAYTVRILPLGGYVRMAGWGEDSTEIKTGTPVTLSMNADGIVTRINLTKKQIDPTALPMNVTSFDFEEKLEISGLVIGENQTYKVDHDASIIEEDGTEVRIAPLDVQYQNATIWGRLITNFAGPMNNFILSLVVFIVLVFLQGGVPNYDSNQVQVSQDGVLAQAGYSGTLELESLNGQKITNWESLTQAMQLATKDAEIAPELKLTIQTQGEKKEIQITPKKVDGNYVIGVQPVLKTGLVDKLFGGVAMTVSAAGTILQALRDLIASFSLDKLGGPVAIFRVSSQAAQNGLNNVLYLLAFLSINIGIFNLIPIPALDGGKILLNIVEAIRRKPLKQETETYITMAGVIIMVILMISVTWNDIMRLF